MALPTVTISGTSSDDVLLGTFGDDVIYGGAGTTIAVGSDGVDEMSGGFGNDTYIVNDTADVIIENPGEGIDTVYTSQNYTLPSDVENIISFANKGVVLTGNSGNNILDGSQTATNYADQLWGMEGNDIYYLSPKDKVSELKPGYTPGTWLDAGGTDTIVAGFSINISDDSVAAVAGGTAGIENVVLTGSANLNIVGNGLNNRLYGNSGINNIAGGSGNDYLDGGANNPALSSGDTLDGGSGNDTYVWRNANDTITEAAGGGTDTVLSYFNVDLSGNPNEIENITLLTTTNSPLNAIGNKYNNIIKGNEKNNLLNGLDGNDKLYGGAGADNLQGGTGDDWLDGGANSDTMTGGTGNDTYIVNTKLDKIYEYIPTGGSAATEGTADAIRSSNLSIDLSVAADSTSTSSMFSTASAFAIENIYLDGSLNLNAYGNALNNIIEGNAGSNTLAGKAGNDTIRGWAGNDIIWGDGNSTTSTLTGSDILYGGDGNDQIYGGLGNDILYGDTGSDNLFGGDGDDLLDGGTNPLTIVSSGTVTSVSPGDTMTGGLGNDTYIVDSIEDRVVENAGEGTDTISSSISVDLSVNVNSGAIVGQAPPPSIFTTASAANFENITLTGFSDTNATGNGLNNYIVANYGANIIYGLDGNDTLDSGSDNTAKGDQLFGGNGNDTYIVNSSLDTAVDIANDTDPNTQLGPGGIDTVVSSVNWVLDNSIENLTLSGYGASSGVGNKEHNTIIGNTASNIINGVEGNDLLIGGGGNDVLSGGTGMDKFQFSGASASGLGTITITDFSTYYNIADGTTKNADPDTLVFDSSDLLLGGTTVRYSEGAASSIADGNILVLTDGYSSITTAAAAIAANANVTTTNGIFCFYNTTSNTVNVVHSNNLAGDGTESFLANIQNIKDLATVQTIGVAMSAFDASNFSIIA